MANVPQAKGQFFGILDVGRLVERISDAALKYERSHRKVFQWLSTISFLLWIELNIFLLNNHFVFWLHFNILSVWLGPIALLLKQERLFCYQMIMPNISLFGATTRAAAADTSSDSRRNSHWALSCENIGVIPLSWRSQWHIHKNKLIPACFYWINSYSLSFLKEWLSFHYNSVLSRFTAEFVARIYMSRKPKTIA